MNTKLHAACGSEGRPLKLIIAVGQVSDGIGARARRLPNVEWLPGERGYDADWFREALEAGDARVHPGPQADRLLHWHKAR